VIEFGVQLDGHTVTKPQSFLNEAKLTQLALSVRFAASLVNLHESDLKLLVLDDLLVSLDMSNRMQVVDILLSETFAGYQKNHPHPRTGLLPRVPPPHRRPPCRMVLHASGRHGGPGDRRA
jgi:hypothetical protein